MGLLSRSVLALLGSSLLVTASPTAIIEHTKRGTLIARQDGNYECKCYAGDDCWPAEAEWNALNSTVDGQLFNVIPDPAVCYQEYEGIPTYDAVKCAEVTQKWGEQQWQTDQQVSNLWVLWTNMTCLPPSAGGGDTCTQGHIPDYVIMATTHDHIKAGIDFVRENNLRLIIRNTGHDFLGRSTGYGALAINTHSFKDVEFIEQYTSSDGEYNGRAVKVGAGIQGRELYTLANQQNPPQTIVAGECPTVGFAGGYIQGGGHGPMSTHYGMAADQVLEFEVITADGEFVTANAAENADLFWAVAGGGPSTFAAVLTVTIKTFDDAEASGFNFDLTTTDPEEFWKGVEIFHSYSNHWIENGMFVYFELGHMLFRVHPAVAPKLNEAQLENITQPLLDELTAANIPHTFSTKTFQSFYDLYIDMFEDEGTGSAAHVGGRIFTKKDIAEHNKEIVEAYRLSAEGAGMFFIGHIVGPGEGLPTVNNAIHPTWRQASTFTISSLAVPFDASKALKDELQDYLTNVGDAALRDASPNGAAYVNEGNLEEPNWQEAYWGSNYPRLLELKEKWDSGRIFYARTTPGTEDWAVIDDLGRLCKKV
ncbi:hypothetical protein AJ80_03206 [Polytolypa hystricis UAMH7299]|uniref:FAD-binding PCMH-type domain-containing protein n=1 Tax=Polytolypa hystricis (strain UAMH7299) TaxID=1447883 RepID=A0A2B7YL18_POLH7|nr:hypothetical protein AJ80_03206 [Polytolypa hystricis UAMH7299]